MAEAVNRPLVALQFFISKGLKPWQAAGLVGNFQAESGASLNPGAIGDNGTSFGIYQARGSRFDIIKNVAAKNGTTWRDFNSQLEAAWIDLTKNETTTYAKLRRARNVEEATAAAIGFERPRGWSAGNPRGGHNWKGRLAYAKGLAGPAGQLTAKGGGGGEDGKGPVYDKTAKDDMIPVKDRDPMEVAGELDFSDDGDYGFGVTSEGFEGLPFEPLPTSDDDDGDMFQYGIPEPPGEVASFPDFFGDLYPVDEALGIPDPPGPIPEFATFQPLPSPGTTFRERVMGLPSARNPIPKADFGGGEDV